MDMTMKEDIITRRFASNDVDQVSRLIIDNLTSRVVQDYGEPAVEQLSRFYSPELLREYAQYEEIYVALTGSEIIGTISLDKDRVRNVFVRLDHHGQGIGTMLMQYLEERARQQGRMRLRLSAHVSAVDFYLKHGYVVLEATKETIGDSMIEMILMEKSLEQQVPPN